MKKTSFKSLIAASAVVTAAMGCASSHQGLMAVNVPVGNLRAQPRTSARLGAQDPLQETQLLYGERVRILDVQDGWASIEAVEQPEFTHSRRWQGYPGWVPFFTLLPWDPLLEPNIVITEKWVTPWQDPNGVRPSAWRLPMGTRLRAMDMAKQLWRVELLDRNTVWIPYTSARSLVELAALPAGEKRRLVLHNAERFVDDSYFWGGRSPATSESSAHATGVDCSGLVNLTYRTAGIDIPRDAHEQYLRAKPIRAPQPADLIFLSERGNPQRIVHVMLYAGQGDIIEGPGTGESVRRISVAARLGQSLDWIENGAVVNEQTVFFGSYLP